MLAKVISQSIAELRRALLAGIIPEIVEMSAGTIATSIAELIAGVQGGSIVQ